MWPIQEHLGGGTTLIFFNKIFNIFAYSEKKHKNIETNLSMIGTFAGPAASENPKMQNIVKNRSKGQFPKIQKICKYIYPILYQNAKFGGPGVRNVD